MNIYGFKVISNVDVPLLIVPPRQRFDGVREFVAVVRWISFTEWALRVFIPAALVGIAVAVLSR